MCLADLHIHTTASDGLMSAAMVLNNVAVATPLDLIEITYHKTMEGYERARESSPASSTSMRSRSSRRSKCPAAQDASSGWG